MHALLAADIGTGVRQGELFGFEWGDIDFEKSSRDFRWSLRPV